MKTLVVEVGGTKSRDTVLQQSQVSVDPFYMGVVSSKSYNKNKKAYFFLFIEIWDKVELRPN